jgi:DNA invertase Pin-like site-specific DNA recombinase
MACRRRTRAEVQQFVGEFVDSGMGRSEFCRNRGLSLSTLGRHLRKRRRKGSRKSDLADIARRIVRRL